MEATDQFTLRTACSKPPKSNAPHSHTTASTETSNFTNYKIYNMTIIVILISFFGVLYTLILYKIWDILDDINKEIKDKNYKELKTARSHADD